MKKNSKECIEIEYFIEFINSFSKMANVVIYVYDEGDESLNWGDGIYELLEIDHPHEIDYETFLSYILGDKRNVLESAFKRRN